MANAKSLEIDLQASVKKVELVTKIDKSVVIRRMRMRLEREFDPLLARAIGGDSLDVLKALKNGGLEKGTIPIDAILARIELAISNGKSKDDQVVIAAAVGRKATASAPTADEDDDDRAPSIMLEFEFPFSEAAWAWFGRNTGGYAEISFSAAQLKLAKAS